MVLLAPVVVLSTAVIFVMVMLITREGCLAHVEGRKYEVTLPDGRVVSRQRAYMIENPEKRIQAGHRYRDKLKRIRKAKKDA